MWNNEPDVEPAKLTAEALKLLWEQVQREPVTSHPRQRFIVSHQMYAHLIQNQDMKCGCPACYMYLGRKPDPGTVDVLRRMLEG